MKKYLSFLLALAMFCTLLSACGTAAPAETTAAQAPAPAEAAAPAAAAPATEPVELIVFAAASMKETLTTIGEQYKTVAPNVTLSFNFDSSGTLKTQIAEGADCDLFISAAPRQMNQLDGALKDDADKNPDGLDFVMQGTRCNLLENKVTLVVPEGNPKDIQSFDDLAAKLLSGGILLAMGNGDVPVGQYTQKIFAHYGIDESAVASCLTYGSNVKEVTTQVAEGAADCGVVYATDAFSAGLTVVDEATAEMCGQVIYPAAVLRATQHEAEAKAFLDYLKGADATAVFASVGFTSLAK